MVGELSEDEKSSVTKSSKEQAFTEIARFLYEQYKKNKMDEEVNLTEGLENQSHISNQS